MNIITSTSFIQSRDEKKKQSSQLPTSNFKKKNTKKKVPLPPAGRFVESHLLCSWS